MTSNEDISDKDNSYKTERFQSLFKKRPDCKKLAQNNKFWIAKLKEDYNIDYKSLTPSTPFTEYVNFTRITDRDFGWYFVYESDFTHLDPRHDLTHRRMIVLNKTIELYTKLKHDGIKLLPITDVKLTIGKEMYTIEILPQGTQVVPAGKIIKSLNEVDMGAWHMLFSSAEFKLLYDRCIKGNVTLINSGVKYFGCIIFECKPYYVCVTPTGPLLLHSEDLNIDNIVQVPTTKLICNLEIGLTKLPGND